MSRETLEDIVIWGFFLFVIFMAVVVNKGWL